MGDGSLGHARGTTAFVAASGRGFRRPPELAEGEADVLLRATGRRHEDHWAGRPLDNDSRWAEDITQKIVQRVAELHLLVEEAHAGKAHLILGYSRWDDYVREHFNFGRTQAHNYLLQGRVVRALGAAANGATVEVAPGHAKRIHPVLDEVVEVLRRFVEAGHDPEWSVQAVIDWYGRPSRTQAIGVVKALPEVRDAMGLQLVETGALAELEPDYSESINYFRFAFAQAIKAPAPPHAYLKTLSHAERSKLRRQVAAGEQWLAALREGLDELPPGPPMPEPPTRRRRTTPRTRRTPPAR